VSFAPRLANVGNFQGDTSPGVDHHFAAWQKQNANWSDLQAYLATLGQGGASSLFIDVKLAGAKGDGVTDDYAVLQACLDAAAAAGGGHVLLPPGNYLIRSMLVINGAGVHLVGTGPSGYHNNQTLALIGAVLTWGGGQGATMLRVTAVDGGAQYLTGCSVLDVSFDGKSIGGIALEILSHRYGEFRIFARNTTSTLVRLGCVTTLTADARDPQHNFIRLVGDQRATMGSVCFFDGSTGANSSYNTFEINADVLNGQGVVFGNSDNNYGSIRIFRGATFTANGTFPNDIEFQGQTPAVGGAARNNVITYANAGSAGANPNGIYCRGTQSTYDGVNFYTAASNNNEIRYLDKTNAATEPVIDASASCYVTTVDETKQRRKFGSGTIVNRLVFDDTSFFFFGPFTSVGAILLPYWRVTTDTSAHSMSATNSDATSHALPFINNQFWTGSAHVGVIDTVTGETAAWQCNFLAKRFNSTNAIVGGTFTLIASDFGATPATPTMTISTNNALSVQVQANSTNQSNWSGRLIVSFGGPNGF
jgi:Pectate lyase superfamily protein